MYLLTRILFLSWWLICWNRFQPVLWGNYFPGKASYTRTSLQNLKCRALTQATKEHEAHGAGALRSHSHCLAQLKKPESAGKTHKIVNWRVLWEIITWNENQIRDRQRRLKRRLDAWKKCFMLLDSVIDVPPGTEEYQLYPAGTAAIGYDSWCFWLKGKCWKEKILTSKLLESAKKAHGKSGQRIEKQCRMR